MKAIKELQEDIEKLNVENLAFHKSYENRTGHGWAQWSEYQKWINFNVGTLDSIQTLVKEHRYRDCYILIRPVLEAYLLIKLSMLGNTIFFDLLPKKNGKVMESKEELLARAKNDPELKKADVVKMKLIKDESGYRVRILFREKPVGGSREFVPRHYFFAKEYDPDTQYLSDLILKNQWHGIKYPTKDHKKKNRDIQRNFLRIGALLDFFSVKKFASPRERQAIFVHYSYLSKFTHSTVRAYDSLAKNHNGSNPSNLESLFKKNTLHELLILLYCAFLSLYFLKLQLDYFGRESDLVIRAKRRKEIRELTKAIEDKYSFFWFIYNKPHTFDLWQYQSKREISQNANKKIPIPYYVDPYHRLEGLMSTWSNPILGRHEPPPILRAE